MAFFKGNIVDGPAKRLLWLLLAVILGIAGAVLFVVTENMNRTVVIADMWTVVNAAILVLCIACVTLGLKGGWQGAERY